MPRRAVSSRSAAARRAIEAKAARDAERLAREDKIQSALTDYYQATAEAERIRAAGQRRMDAIAAAAERSAVEPAAAAHEAVRRLRDLTGTAGEVARLCQLSVTAVREVLAAPAASPGCTETAGAAAGDSGSVPEHATAGERGSAAGHPAGAAHGNASEGTGRSAGQQLPGRGRDGGGDRG